MQTNFVSFSIFSFVLGLVFFMSACVGDSAHGGSVVNQSSVNSPNCSFSPCSPADLSIVEKPVKQIVCVNPVIAGIAYDQTGSMRWSGTSSLSVQDLQPLIEQIANCGGEIGVTFVRADSAKPVERLRADEPPPLPLEPTRKPNEEDYEFADRIDGYDHQMKTRNEELQRYRKEFQPKIDEYLSNLAPLLAVKPKGNTDFWTSVNHLDVFLAEGDAPWRTKPHRYLIIISDGEDTIGKEKHAFKSDAVIVWVNANASEKSLKDFPYQRVESFPAAMRVILAGEGVK